MKEFADQGSPRLEHLKQVQYAVQTLSIIIIPYTMPCMALRRFPGTSRHSTADPLPSNPGMAPRRSAASYSTRFM